MTQDKQVRRYSNGHNSQTEPGLEVYMTGKRRKHSQAVHLAEALQYRPRTL
jgi:hypothetical protein